MKTIHQYRQKITVYVFILFLSCNYVCARDKINLKRAEQTLEAIYSNYSAPFVEKNSRNSCNSWKKNTFVVDREK